MSEYSVRAVHCEYTADDEEVFQALSRATEPLKDTWERLSKAKRIGIKINQDKPVERWVRHEGQLQQLVSEKVVRALLRLLRQRTDADLICSDVSFYGIYEGTNPVETATALPLLKEFGVEYVDCTKPPYQLKEVPGGGQMFKHYMMPQSTLDVDEFISVAKMKNHAFMGITLSLKNLFGLMPTEPEWHARTYFHHLVRMPYMLADLGRIFDPVLNVIDGLIAQAGQEWGNGLEEGPVRIANTIVAGNQTIATDVCAAHLMGHDPTSDWLTPPFLRDRNALLAASEAGFGTVDLSSIDFQSEVKSPLAHFYSNPTDSHEMVVSWRKTTCEQGLFYRENMDRFFERYAGEYILLQEGEVRWHDKVSDLRGSRRKLSGDKPEQAMWLKYVDVEEAEGERFEVYEKGLQQINSDKIEGS